MTGSRTREMMGLALMAEAWVAAAVGSLFLWIKMSLPMISQTCQRGVCWFGWVVLLAGCGQDMGDIASRVRETASKGADRARQMADGAADTARDTTTQLAETAGMAGQFDLDVGEPLQTSACYVQLITLGPDRPAVLQLQSYRDAERESFPSVFLRAEVTEGDYSALVGQTFEAEMFVKPQAESATLSTRDGPIQVRIDAIDDEQLTGEILAGSLTTSTDGTARPISGTFRGRAL